MFDVCTTNAINAAANFDGKEYGRLYIVDLALFFICLIAASAWGVCDPWPRMLSSTPSASTSDFTALTEASPSLVTRLMANPFAAYC